MAKSKPSPATTIRGENVIIRYFKETRAELRRVAWPTRDETRTLTGIIVAVTVAMGIFLGLLDFIFQEVSAGVIGREFIFIGLAIVLFAGGVAAFYFNSQE